MENLEKLFKYLELLQSVKRVNEAEHLDMETKLNDRILNVCDFIEKELKIQKPNNTNTH